MSLPLPTPGVTGSPIQFLNTGITVSTPPPSTEPGGRFEPWPTAYPGCLTVNTLPGSVLVYASLNLLKSCLSKVWEGPRARAGPQQTAWLWLHRAGSRCSGLQPGPGLCTHKNFHTPAHRCSKLGAALLPQEKKCIWENPYIFQAFLAGKSPPTE